MFSSSTYKKIAKKQLKGRMKTPVLSVLISFLIISAVNFDPAAKTIKHAEQNFAQTAAYVPDQVYSWSVESTNSSPELLILILSMAISGIVYLALTGIFISLFKTTEKVPFAQYFKGYSNWLTGALSMLWYSLWVSLWSLLFVIPGIVKSFAYSQMFFILAENPGIGVRKAMKLSKILTKGYKADLFMMGLSFIGWEFLSIFTCGILQLWIKPYELMSFTNAYKDLKNQAIRTGLLSETDFN